MATILIVDDKAENRDLASTILRCRGHKIVEAADGEEALATVSNEIPDLVIADILMPKMDGFELVSRLRRQPHTAGIKIILSSAAYRDSRSVALAESCGVHKMVPKPIDPEEFLKTVDDLLAAKGISAPTNGLALKTATFNREHFAVVQNKLLEKVAELELLNSGLEAAVAVKIQELHTQNQRLQQEIDERIQGGNPAQGDAGTSHKT